MKTFKKVVGILTLFGMFVGAFPQSAVADVVPLEEAVQIESVNFTRSLNGSDPINVPVNPDGSFQLEISGNKDDEYQIGIDMSVNNPEELLSGIYDLNVEGTQERFARLEIDDAKNITLLDSDFDEPLIIAGDYREGIYPVTGDIKTSESTGDLKLQFIMVISNGLSVAVDGTFNNYEQSESPQLVGPALFVEDASDEVGIESRWSLAAKRPGALTSYDVSVHVFDRAGNKVEKILPYDLKIYNQESESTLIEQEFVCPTVTLNEPLIATPPAQRFESYQDIGGVVEFENSVLLWFGGDLDLTKIFDNYKLSYQTECLIEGQTEGVATGFVTSNNTRIINVVDTKGPNALTNYVATGFDGYVQIKWVNPNNLDFNGVNIYRSTESNFDWKTATPYAQVEKEFNSYEDKNVINGTTYYYVLVPRDDMSPANYGEATAIISATPNVVLVAAAKKTTGENASYTIEEKPEEAKDVKSDVEEKEEKPQENEEDKALPAFGIFVLVLLGAIGIYLLYLQKPEWFSWLTFWKKK